MQFDLRHPDKVRTFPTKEEADALCPADTGSIEYSSIFTKKGNGWIICRKHAGNITGFLEKENA